MSNKATRNFATPCPGFCAACFLACVWLIAAPAFGQSGITGSVKGKIIDDSTKSGLEFVNVLLLRRGDSSLVTGTVTQGDGTFELTAVPPGEYMLKFSILGYEEKLTAAFHIDAGHRRLIVGTIGLRSAAMSLAEVTVTAQAPKMEHLIDRMVYHVDQDIASRTASASEILENIPSVQVDIDGEVSLRGSKRVLLMINGKRSPALEKQEGTFLDQLPASAIEKVEVITTPSARYRAEGKSGIINIVLKKDSPLGSHGTISAQAGTGGRWSGSARVNSNPGGLNFFGSFTIRRDNKDHRTSDVRETQSVADPTLSSVYSDTLFAYANPVTQLVALGIDYRMDEFNSAGVNYNYFQNSFSRTDYSQRMLRNIRGVPSSVYSRDDAGYDFDKENTISANFEHLFGRIDHKLRIEFTAAGSPETDDYQFTNTYFSPPFPSTYDNTKNDQRDDRGLLTVDYSNAFETKSTLEMGFTGESNRTRLDFYAERYDPIQNAFTIDSAKSSNYEFTESLLSWYATYKQRFGKFSVLVGVRFERDRQTSELVTLDSTITHTFVNVFPSLHLSYAFGKGRMLKMSYGRRVSRPRPRELNPFAEYRDPRNVSYGNPDLLPEYVHAVECGYQIHEGDLYLLPRIFYRYSSNDITPLKEIVNRSTILTTRQNVSSDQFTGLEVIGSLDFGDAVSVNLSATGWYEALDATNLGAGLSQNTFAWTGTMNCNFRLSKETRIQLHGHANSTRLTPQGKYFPSYSVNLSVRQEFLDRSLALTVTGTDLFGTLVRHYELDIPGFQQTVYTARESTIFWLGLQFRFGNVLPDKEEDQFQYEED